MTIIAMSIANTGGRLVLPGLKVLKVSAAKKAMTAIEASVAGLEPLGRLALLELRVPQELRVLRAQLGPLARRELRDHQAALLDHQALQALQARKDLKGLKGRKGHKEPSDLRDRKVCRATLVNKVPKDLKGRRGHKVSPVLRGRKGPKDL